ncbi:MAG TPA: radical SAM protein, partial [Fibrobacteria bacterium]|nr:radical SAM protein [Fibrobacteria bacterium]
MSKNSPREVRDLFQKGLFHHHYANTAYPLTPRSFQSFRVDDPSAREHLLVEDWNRCQTLALYTHVPFCKVRCRFCEYAVVSGPDAELEDLYVELLLKEIAMYGKIVGPSKTVVGYDIGGGTPSKLSLENLRRITSAVRDTFQVPDSVVFSAETTPVIAANEPEKIHGLFQMGYRRISMGIQTVSEKLLNELGREGATQIYERAMINIRAAGFAKVNIDLMYGFLHQDLEDFETTLRYATSLGPDFVTLYRNRYKGTRIENEAGGVSIYKVIQQYRLAHRLLNEQGYLGNPGKNTFSRVPGDWGTSDYLTERVIKGTPYLGMGLGAQSFGREYLAYNEGAATKKMDLYRRRVEEGAL